MSASNNDNNLTGENIKTLREAYGETKEELGDAIYTSRTNINFYEKGERHNVDTLRLIAQHFMVLEHELTSVDLSNFNLQTLNIENITTLIRSFELIFPIKETNQALDNKHFNRAYSYHKKLYDAFKHFAPENIDSIRNIMDLYCNLSDCLDEYNEAYIVNDIKTESAINYVAMFYIFNLPNAALPYIVNKVAMMKKLGEIVPSSKNAIDYTSKMPKEDLMDLLPLFFKNCFEHKYSESLEKMMDSIQRSQGWLDLAYYYDALSHVYNIVKNNMDLSANYRYGYDTLKRIANRGNKYAEQFLSLCPDLLE